jgi:hypothetical protein
MEDSDTDNDTTDKDTDGTGSVEVFDVRNEEPGVNVEGEMKADVSFKCVMLTHLHSLILIILY